MGTEYIEEWARKRASGQSAACRRAIDDAVAEVRKRLADKVYSAQIEVFEDLDNFVKRDGRCAKPKPPLRSGKARKQSTKRSSK